MWRYLRVLVGCSTLLISTAHADDYGCTVLLCLSNPAGPMAVAECVSPIKKLFRDLARGRAFPRCGMVDGGNGTYATPTATTYSPCPAGTQPAGQGTVVARGAPDQNNPDVLVANGAGVSQARQCESSSSCSGYTGPRACVANYLGMSDGAAVYGTVVWQQPNGHGIDVYVDNARAQSVQW